MNLLEACRCTDNSPLSVFDDEELGRLQSLVRVIRRHEASIIYEEGDSAMEGYFVCDGEAELFRRIERGGGLVLFTLGEGDIFGVEEILADRRAYSCSVRVFEGALLVALPREELLRLLKSSLPFSFEVMRRLSHHSLKLQGKLSAFVEKSVAQRLAMTLAGLSERYGQSREGSIEIRRPLTNQELAEMIGTTPETVSALLGSFKEKSIVERRGRTFLIRKPEELGRLS